MKDNIQEAQRPSSKMNMQEHKTWPIIDKMMAMKAKCKKKILQLAKKENKTTHRMMKELLKHSLLK